ncbi:MAG: copper amine oxidase N-terminal domain-containing protein [Syntrophomonadaceae bacterium]|jgi:hypothetical protein
MRVKSSRTCLVVLLLSLFILLAGAGAVEAATVNSVNRIVAVGDDYQGYPRTDLTITEGEHFAGHLQAGDLFQLILPEGVKWYEDAVSGKATFHSGDISCQNCSVAAELRNERVVDITIVDADPDAVSRLNIPLVFAVDGYLGDIAVTIDPFDSGVSGGQYLFAQVPYKEVLIPSPEPKPEPVPEPVRRETVFTIGSPLYTIDGDEQAAMDVAPYIKAGRTYLPVRYVAYSLGIGDEHIQWDNETRKVTLTLGHVIVQIQIDSNVITHNGLSSTLDATPEIVQDRTMLPIAAVARAFGATVEWEQEAQTVTITMDK